MYNHIHRHRPPEKPGRAGHGRNRWANKEETMKTNDHKVLKHSYKETVKIVTTIVNEWNPDDLISAGAPDNEFSHEVTQIVAKIDEINTPIALAEVLSGVFSKEFESELFTIEECMPVASRLFTALKAQGLLD